ncbi:DUF3089 domain-containing protein [Candidatus Methanomassiliicoccus intestinalis]|uniref:DUF3089 domain-containing protein n=1 Tax=Candidatus Methanomassiliicoccus intestinalis TaxID=1406512 RepID=UPI0037DCEE72
MQKTASSLLVILVVLSALGATAAISFSDSDADVSDFSVDYADESHWLALPEVIDKPVDVFYVYPTVWHKVSADEPNICTIDNETMLAGAPQALATQATAFATTGNIFAPYYRQADAAYCLSLSLEEQTALLTGAPKEDLFNALDYYFEYYNENRPFILAGHSQGSNMLLFVLSEYMQEHPQCYERMIAAYVVGYSVTADYLAANPHLQFAEGADDTGVIISYNTEAPGVQADNPVLLPQAQVINPISWVRDETPAAAADNLGSYIDGKYVANLADATLDLERGVVICSTVDSEEFSIDNGIFPPGVYHGQDYSFYYYNLRANAELRVSAYLGGVA